MNPYTSMMIAVVVRTAWGGGMLIEAEAPARRESESKEFASVYRDTSAFGRAGVTRFFLAGMCHYRVTLDQPAEALIWLRYVSNQDQKLSFRVGRGMPEKDSDFQVAALPGTGGLEGGEWRWELLGAVKLDAGDHILTLRNAPIRPDCIWVGLGDSPPESPSAMNAERMGEVRRHLERPIEPVVPDWLAAADDYRLPEWYDAIRVCAHTRLSWTWYEKNPDLFLAAGQKLASVGFASISRHIRSGSEAVWWPSAVGDVLPEAKERNFAKEIIDEAHAAGCRILVYHRHMEDSGAAREHPEWRVLDVHGKPVLKRGQKVCLHTPYADWVEARLVELAKMGADGFYFDEVHMEKPLCWCPACRAGFKAETGLEYPKDDDPYHWIFQKAIEYKNVVMERVFRRWRAAVHAANPECVMLIGSNTWPSMNDRHFTHRLCRITDAMKTEFNVAARTGNNRIFKEGGPLAMPETDARIVLGYALSRDACDGRPAHVWTHNLSDSVSSMFATAGMIAHGLVANLDIRETHLPQHELVADAVALGNRVAPAFAGLRPVRWGLIHFSEQARDHDMPDEEAAWRNVLYPTYGAFTAMLRARLPVGILTDSQLEQGRLEGCGVLFLPAPDRLTDPMKRAVEAFEARGGRVVRQQADWAWHEAGGVARCSVPFLDAARRASRAPPAEARGGPEKMHLVAFKNEDRSRFTVALVNDFSWVQTGGKPKPTASAKSGKGKAVAVRAEGEDEPTIDGGATGKPDPCRGVSVILRSPERPASVTDVVTGRDLPVSGARGEWIVEVPEFECLAVLRVTPGS